MEEHLARLLEQLAGKFLKELRWNFWRNSGGILIRTCEELLVEILRNSEGVPGWTPKEHPDEFRRHSRWSSEGILGVAPKDISVELQLLAELTAEKFPMEGAPEEFRRILWRNTEGVYIGISKKFQWKFGVFPGWTLNEFPDHLWMNSQKNSGVFLGEILEYLTYEVWKKVPWELLEEPRKNSEGIPGRNPKEIL